MREDAGYRVELCRRITRIKVPVRQLAVEDLVSTGDNQALIVDYGRLRQDRAEEQSR